MRKKVFIISILAFIFSVLITVWWQYRNISKRNYSTTAEPSSKNDKVTFIVFGFHMPSSKDKEIDSVAAVYGFEFYNRGCVVSDEELKTTAIHNNSVEQYLTKRNGKTWRINYKKIVDSLYNVAFKRSPLQ